MAKVDLLAAEDIIINELNHKVSLLQEKIDSFPNVCSNNKYNTLSYSNVCQINSNILSDKLPQKKKSSYQMKTWKIQKNLSK